MGKRKVISESAIQDAIRAGHTRVSIPPGAIVTPLARDAARDRGIALVTGSVESPAPTSPRARSRSLVIGSDHGGFEYKRTVSTFVRELGWELVDVGTDSEKSCDYPDFAYAVARMVAEGRAGLGIMIDGAGIGSAMVCNKVPGVRAACAYNEFTAWNARAHNDANVLTLGSRTLGIEVCKGIVRAFLATDFEGGRHEGRVAKITDVEGIGR